MFRILASIKKKIYSNLASFPYLNSGSFLIFCSRDTSKVNCEGKNFFCNLWWVKSYLTRLKHGFQFKNNYTENVIYMYKPFQSACYHLLLCTLAQITLDQQMIQLSYQAGLHLFPSLQSSPERRNLFAFLHGNSNGQ